MNEGYFLRNPQLEQRYSAALLERAKELAKALLERSEECSDFAVGDQENAYFLSRNSADVIGSQEIDIDGVKFFLGMKKETAE